MTLNTTDPDDCTDGPNWEVFIHCSLAPAFVIVLILSFFGKRYNARLKSLLGIDYLAVVYPINLLDDHEHRWSHGLAFGATASIILSLFSGSYTELYFLKDPSPPAWINFLLGAVATIEIGIVLFPFFACITSPSRLVGSLLGFMYVAVWFSVMLAEIIACPNVEGGGFAYENVVLQLPVIIFTFLLMVRFLYYLIQSVRTKVRGNKLTSEERLMQSYQGRHVKALLRPPPIVKIYTKTWERIAYRWYEPSTTFVYPTRIIVTFVVAVLCQYEIAIQMIYTFDNTLGNWFVDIREWYDVYIDTYNVSETDANRTMVSIDKYETAAHVSWFVAAIFSIVLSLSYIGHIFVCFRKHILRLHQGDRKFLPDIHQSSVKRMVGSLQYCGFQIAYYLSGYIIITFTAFVFMYIISGALVIPLINDALSWIKGFFNHVVPFLAVVIIIFGSQPFLAKRVFLQPKLDQNGKEKPLALQHREFYHTFSYFLVFLNVLVGFMSCVIRILTGLVVGVFLVCRIDRPILMRGFENLDQSYQAYVGNLEMINAHSHPVLVVFCQILVNRIMVRKRARLRRNKSTSTGTDLTGPYEIVERDNESISPHARAVMRWQVAYTLIFNPTLLHTRKRSRQISYDEMEKRVNKVATLLPHRQQVLQRSNAERASQRGRKVVSGPIFHPDADDKTAAELLNRELMDDVTDLESSVVSGEVGNRVETVDAEVIPNGEVKMAQGNGPSTEALNLRSFGVYGRTDTQNSGEINDHGVGHDDPKVTLRDTAPDRVVSVPINPQQQSDDLSKSSYDNPIQIQRLRDEYESRHSAAVRHDDSGADGRNDYDNVVIHLDVPKESSADESQTPDPSDA